MKITVKQLKQLIREQVEEITFSGYGGGSQIEPKREPNYSSAFTHDVMLGGLGSETPAGEDKEFVAEERTDWVKDNQADIRYALQKKNKFKKKAELETALAQALEKAKKAFYKVASYDPDFMGRAQDVEDLLPGLKRYFEWS